MNPQTLTPPWLNFRVITLTPIEMAVSTRIGYRLKIHLLAHTLAEPDHRVGPAAPAVGARAHL